MSKLDGKEETSETETITIEHIPILTPIIESNAWNSCHAKISLLFLTIFILV